MSIERVKRNLRVLTTCDIDQEQWLDYIEGELAPSLQSDMKLHLEGCTQCKETLADLKAVKTAVKISEVKMPSDEFFKTLETKIMASLDSKVEGAEKNKVAVARVYVFMRNITLPLAATAALFLLVFGALYKSTRFDTDNSTEATTAKLEEQFIVQAAYNDPKLMSNFMISHQNELDWVMNAAAEKLSHMSERDAAKTLKKMK